MEPALPGVLPRFRGRRAITSISMELFKGHILASSFDMLRALGNNKGMRNDSRKDAALCRGSYCFCCLHHGMRRGAGRIGPGRIVRAADPERAGILVRTRLP